MPPARRRRSSLPCCTRAHACAPSRLSLVPWIHPDPAIAVPGARPAMSGSHPCGNHHHVVHDGRAGGGYRGRCQSFATLPAMRRLDPAALPDHLRHASAAGLAGDDMCVLRLVVSTFAPSLVAGLLAAEDGHPRLARGQGLTWSSPYAPAHSVRSAHPWRIAVGNRRVDPLPDPSPFGEGAMSRAQPECRRCVDPRPTVPETRSGPPRWSKDP